LEEFFETHQQILPVPSIASFVATIFIAFGVGVFGVVLTYAVDPGSKLTASIFCWLSVALFVGAFWDLRVRSAKRRSRSVQDLRAIYKTYHSGDGRLSLMMRMDFANGVRQTGSAMGRDPDSGGVAKCNNPIGQGPTGCDGT